MRLKTALENALCGAGIPALSRQRHRGDVLVLAYHDIIPDGAPPPADASLHLPRAEFARQLDLIRATHEVVPLPAALEPGRHGRPRAVITFDDAYQGAITLGVEELVRRGLPATVFVAPGLLGGDFWWDVLGADDGGLSPARRAHALDRLGGHDATIREWARREGAAMVSVERYARCATEQELLAAARRPGIALGCHGWSHCDLTRLDAAALRRELEQPLAWLRARVPDALAWLSYPYGRTAPAVEAAAARAGYEGALLIEGGYIRLPATERFRLPRLNVPSGISVHGLELHASGLL